MWFLFGRNIPTLPKIFFKKKRAQKKKKDNFFLFFVFYFLFAFVCVTTLEASFEEKHLKETAEKSDLFLSYDRNGSENNNDVVFAHKNSIIAQSTSYFIDSRVFGSKNEERRGSIISYKIKEGDSIENIADSFGVSVDTIKWANSIENNKIKTGDELLILPVTGVLYYIERNDSLGGIAQKHKASVSDIVKFNNIEDEKSINPGEALIIPSGRPAPKPVPERTPTVHYAGLHNVTHGTITQTSHYGHLNAVDIANRCGTSIYAMTSGTVTSTGSDPRMAGNYIWINHGGMDALYAHLQSIDVSPGQTVVAGQKIGKMGNTGYTIGATGCHLHFETRRSQNPFRYLQRGQRM